MRKVCTALDQAVIGLKIDLRCVDLMSKYWFGVSALIRFSQRYYRYVNWKGIPFRTLWNTFLCSKGIRYKQHAQKTGFERMCLWFTDGIAAGWGPFQIPHLGMPLWMREDRIRGQQTSPPRNDDRLRWMRTQSAGQSGYCKNYQKGNRRPPAPWHNGS